MSTQPLPVLYKGKSFRNELTARWAVFFDALDMPWEYAAQEFSLPYGGAFIPDFWLPVQHIWLHIKSELPEEPELIKAADLSFATRRWVYVVWGEMGSHSIYGFNLPFYEQGYDKRYVFTLCDETEELMVASPLRSDDEYQLIGYCNAAGQAILQKARVALANPRLLAAYQAARDASFERAVS